MKGKGEEDRRMAGEGEVWVGVGGDIDRVGDRLRVSRKMVGRDGRREGNVVLCLTGSVKNFLLLINKITNPNLVSFFFIGSIINHSSNKLHRAFYFFLSS